MNNTENTSLSHSPFDVAIVAQAASGQWKKILHEIGGIPLDRLDGKLHDCPKCGAADAFRLICNGCGCCECFVCLPRPIGSICACEDAR